MKKGVEVIGETAKISYRRYGRTFYKVDEEQFTCTEITNYFKRSLIKITLSESTCEEVMIDSQPCTEEEFNAAKSEAMKRLTEEKI